MMPDIISGQARRRSGTWRRRPRTRALGGGADADANLAGYSGAGVSREPLPKVHANTALCWLNSPDGATFSFGKAELIGTSHVAYGRILRKYLQNPRRRRPRTRALGGDADANLAGKRPAGYSGAGVSREPLPKGMGAPPLESTQDGENVSKVLRQVSPAVEQASAAGANSRQPSSAQDGENSSTIFNLNELLATLEKASAAGESSGEPSSAQDSENSSTIFNLNELLAALEKASAAGGSSGQRSSAQPDNVGDEEGSGA